MYKVCLLILLSVLLITSCDKESVKEIDFNSFETNSSSSKSETKSTLLERMEHYHVPGVSIAVVTDGKIEWAKGYGISNKIDGQKVNDKTLFQAGSISKPLAALAALKLVEEGKIGLDEDVNIYLRDWKIPKNKFTKDEKVTLRRLLTHTAGVTVHGFPGYKRTDTLPAIEDVLNGKGNTPAIYVDTIPGSIWRYSGGGYIIVQKLVEDISGLPFEKYMAQSILKPIGMENSTFYQPLPSHLHAQASAGYSSKGKIMEGLWNNYPEQAAAGLWTTPTDLAKFCIEIQEILLNKKSGVLSRETVEIMLTAGKNNWGLGLMVLKKGDSLIGFAHRGKNFGYSSDMTASIHKRSALIIMTNGDNGTQLIDEIKNSIFGFYNK